VAEDEVERRLRRLDGKFRGGVIAGSGEPDDLAPKSVRAAGNQPDGFGFIA
jgi:hypothetical protein